MQDVLKREISSECCHSVTGMTYFSVLFLYKNTVFSVAIIKVFGAVFKALIRIHLIPSIWVSEVMSEANARRGSDKILMPLAPVLNSSNANLLLMTKL